jgi:hypothetical protein
VQAARRVENANLNVLYAKLGMGVRERAVVRVLVAERAEHDKLECAVKKLFADAISPQPVTLSACSAESGATTSAASSGSSAGAPGASERRHLPGCSNDGLNQ